MPNRVATTVHSLLGGVTELLFPSSCCGCGQTLTPDEGHWCLGCGTQLLKTTSSPYCPRCGIASGDYLFDTHGCPECRHTRMKPDGFVRVGTYHDLVGKTLRRFKFNREHRLDRCLGNLLASAITGASWGDTLDALVPVPTDWKGRLRYRCWPVLLLAQEAATHLGKNVCPMLITRGKLHRQVGLPQSQRQHNIRGVFQLKHRARVNGKAICIIDDVSTTGATIQEVTRVLRAAGASSVYAAVIAKTDPHHSDDDPL